MNSAPAFLKQKDKVALIATAKNFDKKEIKDAIHHLEQWGLEVIIGKNNYKKEHQFAGTDAQRLEDLQWALDSKEIKAILCIRGGYGTARIIDDVTWKKFKRSPKWVVGFSDVTTLHAQLVRNKVQSIHGLMPTSFGKLEYLASVLKLKETLFGKKVKYKIKPNKLNKKGKAKAELAGGNLTIICSLIGTSSELKLNGKILFIEDVGENLYRIDRMVNQLKRAGMLKKLAGIIVGHFTDMEDNEVKFGRSALEIIADYTKAYKYPICFGFPAGHEADNFPLILGATVSIAVGEKSATIQQ